MPNHPGYMAYTAIQNERTRQMLRLRRLRRLLRLHVAWGIPTHIRMPPEASRRALYAPKRLPGHRYCTAPPKPTVAALLRHADLHTFECCDFAALHEISPSTQLHEIIYYGPST